MRNYTYVEKMKWKDNARFPKDVEGKYQVNVPNGFEINLRLAMESNEWFDFFGSRRDEENRQRFIDIAMLVYDIYHYDMWSEGESFDVSLEQSSTEDLSKVPMDQRLFDLRFDQETFHPVDELSNIVVSESIVSKIMKSDKKSKKKSISLHRGEHSTRKTKVRKHSKRDKLLSLGFKDISVNRIYWYYKNKKVIRDVLEILSTPYRLEGHETWHQVIIMEVIGDTRYIRFDPYFTKQVHELHLIDRKGFVNGYHEYVLNKWEEMIRDPLLSQEYGNWLQLEKPSEEEVIHKLNSLVGGYHKGKEIKDLATFPKPKDLDERNKSVWKDDWVIMAKKYAYDHSRPVTISWRPKRHGHGRHYSPYNLMPSEVRRLFKWNGKFLAWIDVNGCHIILLLVKFLREYETTEQERLLVNNILQSDHPRKRIAELAGIKDSPWFKESILSWINCPAWMMDEEIEEAKLKGVTTIFNVIGLNCVVRWLKYWKTGIYGHTDISYWLQGEESKLMDDALLKISEGGMFGVGVHDGIDCDPDYVDAVTKIIKASFANHGYPCSLSIETDAPRQDQAA